MTRLGRLRVALRDRYLAVDPRTAGLFRIVLGTVLALDCIRHWGEARLLYSTFGVLPNETHLAQPSAGQLFSFFHAFSSTAEVNVVFTLGLVCHLLLLIGWRPRLFAFLSFLFVTSMDSRIPLVENGGYVVVNLITLYAGFLPIGRRFSVDAWRAAWRSRVETNAAELGERPWTARERERFVSLAGGLVVFNFSIIYLFNVVNKTGNIWRKGDTVHYVLHIDRMVTGLGVFARETLPGALITAADFLTLSVEAIIFACIVWPHARKWTRGVALVLIVGLHTTLGTMMRLGPFSWFMITWSTLLVLPVHWSWLRQRREKRTRGCTIGVDERSPLAIAIGRVVARLDEYGRVSFVPGPQGGLLSLQTSDAGGEPLWEHDGRVIVARALEALPAGSVLARPLGGVFAFLRRREAWVTRFFGLDEPAPEAPPPMPGWARLARVPRSLREAFLAYFWVCVVMQIWLENKAIPKQLPPPVKPGQVLQPHEVKALDWMNRVLGTRVITLKPESPKFLVYTINYFRLYQGWGMFAPNPIQEDGVLAIDAYTIDGRRIDPLTGKTPDLDLTDSRGEGLSQLRQDYGNRIRLDRNAIFREDLKNYLKRWHLQTKRPDDELVAFDVYWVRDKCPQPGKSEPTSGEAVPIATWRKQGYEPRPGVERPPPSPPLKSADKFE